MKTLHSIDLKTINEQCFARTRFGNCKILVIPARKCCYKCKFYKPIECQDWIRIDDDDGINLIPPEEYRRML